MLTIYSFKFFYMPTILEDNNQDILKLTFLLMKTAVLFMVFLEGKLVLCDISQLWLNIHLKSIISDVLSTEVMISTLPSV